MVSVPFAFLGGLCRLPVATYRIILGVVLLFAAWRLAFKQSAHAPPTLKPIILPAALALGAAIGLLSGLTGIGGGIFLSPLLLLLGWADVRKTAGVSAAFIWVNSASGLLGHWESVKWLPQSDRLVGARRLARRGVGGGTGQPPADAAYHAADAGGGAGSRRAKDASAAITAPAAISAGMPEDGKRQSGRRSMSGGQAEHERNTSGTQAEDKRPARQAQANRRLAAG